MGVKNNTDSGAVAQLKQNTADMLKDRVGDDLRTLAFYDHDSYDVVYMRDDVNRSYDDEDIRRIHRENVLNSMNKNYLEDLFEVGELGYAVHRFEDATTLHVLGTGEKSRYDGGAFVSIDGEADIDVEDLAEDITELLS